MVARRETKNCERGKRRVAGGDVTGSGIFLYTAGLFEEHPGYRGNEMVNETLRLPGERFDEGTKEGVQVRAPSL